MATIKVIATKIPAGNQVNGESEDGFLTVLVGREVATVTTKINGVPVMACACCILDDNRRMLTEVLEKNIPKGIPVAMICDYVMSSESDSLLFTREEPSFLKRNTERYQLLAEIKKIQSLQRKLEDLGDDDLIMY